MTTITITGPGGAINYEAYVIKEALEKAGCRVTFNNSCPEKDAEAFCAEGYRRRTDENWAGPEYPSLKGVVVHEVVINVNHLPWGG